MGQDDVEAYTAVYPARRHTTRRHTTTTALRQDSATDVEAYTAVYTTRRYTGTTVLRKDSTTDIEALHSSVHDYVAHRDDCPGTRQRH